jgi:enterochelin esterase-like enzyme
MRSIRVLRLGLLAVGLLCVLLGLSGARGDLIILKDGFVLRGKVIREGKDVIDRTEDGPVREFIASGFYYVDDGARRVIFSDQNVSGIQARKLDGSHIVKWDAGIGWNTQAKAPPRIIHIDSISDWDEKWNRKVVYKGRTVDGQSVVVDVPQHLFVLTPDYAIADSMKMNIRWRAQYLTKELGPETVRELLSHHKDFKDDKKLDEEARISRRFKIYQFLVQGEWLNEAGNELDQILKDYPAAKERVEEGRKAVKSLKAIQLYDDIKRAHDAGQYAWVKKRFADVADSGMPEKMHAELRALQSEYETAETDMQLARRALSDLPSRISIGDMVLKKTMTEAAKTITGELHLEHFLKSKAELRGGDKEGQRIGRLDNFLTQVQQAERIRKNGGKDEPSAEQLLSLAVTGWLLGGRSAETKPEFAWQLWLARKLVLDFQTTVRRTAREKLIADYKEQQSQRNPSISVEEFAQMIPYLPPPEPPAKPVVSTAEFVAESYRGGRAATKYSVQLPPEYHPSRPWPVLVVLHQTDEGPKDAMQRWAAEAARNGYILAAPAWQSAPGATYEYSADEHNTVLDMLCDLRRKFQVDSDRVFLAGSASGGSMAFDVGLSHPDQFAGVLPTCGFQNHWGDRYKLNAQYLPFYTVCGDMAGGLHTEMRRLYKDWIIKSFPMIYVEYKGRGIEQYPAEVAYSFDWMSRKARVFPAGEVGSATHGPFSTIRHEDNRYYWLGSDNIAKVMPAKGGAAFASTMSAKVTNPSQIDVKTSGLKQITVWFSRGMQADITKPLTINVNLAARWSAKMVKPSLTTLLDDFYERGDRQRLYIAKVEINGL